MTQKHPRKKTKKPAKKKFASDFFSFCEDPLFLKQLFSYIGDELVVVDQQGRFLFANDAAVEGFGFPRSYILNKKVVDFLNERLSVSQWKKKYFDELKRRKMPMSYRIERVFKKKEVRTLDITAVYVPYDGQEFILSVGRDVTRQVQLQRALHDSKNLYRFLTEGAREGIAALDMDGRFIHANNRLQEMIGLAQGAYRGKHFIRFVHKASLKKMKNVFERAQKGEQYINEMIDAQAISGEVIPFELSVTPFLKSGKVVSIHLIARDLRLRQKLEEMSRQSEKMDAIRYFVAGIAQELRNPLMGVTKRAEMLLKKYAERDFEYISYREFQDILSNIESMRD